MRIKYNKPPFHNVLADVGDSPENFPIKQAKVMLDDVKTFIELYAKHSGDMKKQRWLISTLQSKMISQTNVISKVFLIHNNITQNYKK